MYKTVAIHCLIKSKDVNIPSNVRNIKGNKTLNSRHKMQTLQTNALTLQLYLHIGMFAFSVILSASAIGRYRYTYNVHQYICIRIICTEGRTELFSVLALRLLLLALRHST